MKIHFIGLSCFLIESNSGHRILVDPFNDAPEWSLGPRFPKEFNRKPFGANIVLISEPDADHAYAPGDWLAKAPPTKPNSDPFPNLDLRGTVVHEWNGDLNIAWHYTVEGLRLAHFADNAHALTQKQLQEIGQPDIIFISPPKTSSVASLDQVRKDIRAIKPKLIIWTHHLAPVGLPSIAEDLPKFFVKYFKKNASTSKNYTGDSSFIELCYVLEHAIRLNKEYSGIEVNSTSIKVTPAFIKKHPTSILFRSMLAKP